TGESQPRQAQEGESRECLTSLKEPQSRCSQPTTANRPLQQVAVGGSTATCETERTDQCHAGECDCQDHGRSFSRARCIKYSDHNSLGLSSNADIPPHTTIFGSPNHKPVELTNGRKGMATRARIGNIGGR